MTALSCPECGDPIETYALKFRNGKVVKAWVCTECKLAAEVGGMDHAS